MLKITKLIQHKFFGAYTPKCHLPLTSPELVQDNLTCYDRLCLLRSIKRLFFNHDRENYGQITYICMAQYFIPFGRQYLPV